MTDPISVLIVEDHPMVASGIAALLEAEPDIRVVAVCDALAPVVGRVQLLLPDVVLLDQRLPDGRGTSLVPQILDVSPKTRVVVVSADPEPGLVRDALATGCAGVISKTRSAHDLVRAVRAVGTGGVFFSAELLAGSVSAARASNDRLARLTAREVEVLQLLAEDLATAQIASRLHLSPHTVGNHVQSILTKLGVNTRLGAVLAGFNAGLVTITGRPESA